MTVICVVSNDGPVGVCNATCHNAVNPECRCVCGGAFHGVGDRIAAEDIKTLSEEEILETAAAVLGSDDIYIRTTKHLLELFK